LHRWITPAGPGEKRAGVRQSRRRKEDLVLDIIMLVLGLILFAVTIAYAHACDRL